MSLFKYITIAFVSFFIGTLFSGVAISIAAPNMLIKEVASPYDFDKTVRVLQERINACPGWHVVTTYDQNAEVVAHGGKPIGSMAIIHYCNGKFASRMLEADDRKKMGVMLPKSVAVYEDSRGKVWIAMSNGSVMGKLFGGETESIIEDVSKDIESIMGFMNFKFSLF